MSITARGFTLMKTLLTIKRKNTATWPRNYSGRPTHACTSANQARTRRIAIAAVRARPLSFSAGVLRGCYHALRQQGHRDTEVPADSTPVRVHLRRGHLRRYGQKAVWVRPALIIANSRRGVVTRPRPLRLILLGKQFGRTQEADPPLMQHRAQEGGRS